MTPELELIARIIREGKRQNTPEALYTPLKRGYARTRAIITLQCHGAKGAAFGIATAGLCSEFGEKKSATR